MWIAVFARSMMSLSALVTEGTLFRLGVYALDDAGAFAYTAPFIQRGASSFEIFLPACALAMHNTFLLGGSLLASRSCVACCPALGSASL